MKKEEIKEIFDEVDVDLMLIQDRLAAAIKWIETGRVGKNGFDSYVVSVASFKTPLEYLKFIRNRIGLTRELFKDWREREKL